MEQYLISKITKKIEMEDNLVPEDYVGEGAEFNMNNTFKVEAEEIEIEGGFALRTKEGEIIATLTEEEYFEGLFFKYNK